MEKRELELELEQTGDTTPRIKKKICKRPKILILDAPPVKSIKNLIELGDSFKLYKNINCVLLWRIAPFLRDLDRIIGMENLKQTLFYQIIYYLQGMHFRGNQDYLHTRIYGSPGTGKTTVAKIIGQLYQAMGVLSYDGPFKVAYRDDFIAGYLGQTAIKTRKLLESCIGGVLFIDEVYALAPRNDNTKDIFSKEAIDTLNGFLSEHKNDMCCIIAGYEDEVENTFFNMNRGLERRFPWVHRIDNYTSKELYEIFLKMVRDTEWEVSAESDFAVALFEKEKNLFKNYGGDVETFLSKCKIMHSIRVFGMEPERKFILTKEDILEGIALMKKHAKKKEDKPPEHMYT